MIERHLRDGTSHSAVRLSARGDHVRLASPFALAQSVVAAELRRWRTASLNGPLSEYFYEDREPRRQNRPAVLIFDFNDELSSIGIR